MNIYFPSLEMDSYVSITEPATGKNNSEHLTKAGKNKQNHFSDTTLLSEHIHLSLFISKS